MRHGGRTAVPDLRFTHEMEAASMQKRGRGAVGLSDEKHSCTEDPFKGRYDAAIPLTTLAHPKRIQHLGGRSKTDHLALLSDRQGGKKDENQPVLPKRKPKLWMAGNLQMKIAIPAVEEELVFGRPPDRQPTKDERSRCKGQ